MEVKPELKGIIREKSFLGFKMIFWWGLLSMTLSMILLSSLLTLSVQRWVEQGSSAGHWRGGLLSCGGCHGEWEDEYYATIVSDYCDKSLNKGLCDTFEKLNIAGILFVLLEVLSIFGLLIWISKVIMNFTKHNVIRSYIYIYAGMIACAALHLLAICIWFGVTAANFDSCEKLGDKEEEAVCATYGPIIAIFNMGLIFISVVLFLLVDFARKKYNVPAEIQ